MGRELIPVVFQSELAAGSRPSGKRESVAPRDSDRWPA